MRPSREVLQDLHHCKVEGTAYSVNEHGEIDSLTLMLRDEFLAVRWVTIVGSPLTIRRGS